GSGYRRARRDSGWPTRCRPRSARPRAPRPRGPCGGACAAHTGHRSRRRRSRHRLASSACIIAKPRSPRGGLSRFTQVGGEEQALLRGLPRLGSRLAEIVVAGLAGAADLAHLCADLGRIALGRDLLELGDLAVERLDLSLELGPVVPYGRL